jgi:hypothetical protein
VSFFVLIKGYKGSIIICFAAIPHIYGGAISNEHTKRNAAETSQQAHSEKLTDRDIKELMGMNRPRYEKRRGSIRQR